MMRRRNANWRVLPGGPHLQLSAVDPPDARHAGPVVGPGTRVRPCGSRGTDEHFRVVCLDVADADGTVRRGYTYQHFLGRRRRRLRWSWLVVLILALLAVAAAIW